MKCFGFFMLLFFSVGAFAYAQELPKPGQIDNDSYIRGVASLKTKYNTQYGFIESVACDFNYLPSENCYLWIPRDSELAGYCFKADLTNLFKHFPRSEKLWVETPEWETFIEVSKAPTKTMQHTSAEFSDDEWHRVGHGNKIDCNP